MTFDEHEPHASPRLYLADFAPHYAGVCAPHDQPGPWGPKIYFTEPIPYDPLKAEALRIIADAMEAENPFNLKEHVDQILMQPTETVQSWDTYMRGEIALEALTSLHDECDASRYEIVIYVGDVGSWQLPIAKRFQSYALKQLEQIGNTVAFETNDAEDVRFFLAGHAWILGAITFLTVVRRTSETTAVVYCG